MSIVEFLTARLDEDEAAAKMCVPGPWDVRGEPRDSAVVSAPTAVILARGWQRDTAHIARHDPARVLREVEAKRRLIDPLFWVSQFGERVDECEGYVEAAARALAPIWSDHPDYDETWRLL